ncbi:MAG: MATE family efflux transporter [Halobacteriales archaeon SW_9_67_25]|nr:MAG: MATE family efflux transporter [Halobacteriales archaeon SW_9_67_25]
MRGYATSLGNAVTALLDRAGVIAPDRLSRTVDLAWPRVITGFAIMSKQTVDLAFVGWAVGSEAVAGLAFAYAFWLIAKFVGVGVVGGTVGLVSQNFGGNERGRASTVVTQSVWLALALSVPVVVVYALFADPLVGLLSSDAALTRAGATYLAIVAPALTFEFLNLVCSRTYAGVGDTLTPMVVRAGAAAANVVVSGVLVFGFGLGVAGVAIGTLFSTGLSVVAFSWGMFGRSYGVPGLAASPVALSVRGPHFDRELMGQLVEVSAPIVARRVLEGLVAFPLLWIAGTFGPVVVAAFEIGRRVRAVMTGFSWGFSIASSSLVGQALGDDDEGEATAYGAAIIRLSVVVYAVAALVVLALAGPIAGLFVAEPAEIAQAAVFIQVSAVSAVAFGLDGSATGALRGAGDTRWPFVASVVGRYAFALPAAALGLVTPLGVAGLYLALVLEMAVPALANYWRFRTGRWKTISRAYRPAA